MYRPRVYVANLGSTRAGGPIDSFQPDLAVSKLEQSVGEGALDANGLASKVCSVLEIRSTDLFLLDLERDGSLDFEGRCSLRSFIVAFSLNPDFLINLALNLESLF